MKLYRKGNNEIRIRLTQEDLEKFSITLEDFDYDSTKGKRIIWELFDRAKEETGFDAAGEKVYIQLYPMDKGGCELFVTKLEAEDKKDCFLFTSFENIHAALKNLSSFPRDILIFQVREKEHFYTLIPTVSVPNLFYEFGEKVSVPSSAYLRSRCRRVKWNKRIEYDND